MRVVLFYHSLLSDWSNNSAAFLRGIAMELLLRGHEVVVYEPRNAWSLQRLLAERGHEPIARFHAHYPGLASRRYDVAALDLERALAEADLVLVHESADPALVLAVGEHRSRIGRYRLLYHVTCERAMAGAGQAVTAGLEHFDGVLASSSLIRERCLAERWTHRAWTWPEAADTRLFKPCPERKPDGDLVWIGDWADERAADIQAFILDPARKLGLQLRVYGAGYTPAAMQQLEAAGAEYAGWVPNYDLPEVFARHRFTVHLSMGSHGRVSGAPPSRPFEALACGIPLVSAGWADDDGLLQPGLDYGLARNGAEMTAWLSALANNPEQAQRIAEHGRRTIERRHTCALRVDELLNLARRLPAQRMSRPTVEVPAEASVAA